MIYMEFSYSVTPPPRVSGSAPGRMTEGLLGEGGGIREEEREGIGLIE